MAKQRLATIGDDYIARFRFPALARLASRSLVIAYEACPYPVAFGKDLPAIRANPRYQCGPSCSDDLFAAPHPNAIHFARSTDAGRNWEATKIINPGDAAAPVGMHNPSFLVNYVTGRLFLFYTKSYDAGYADSLPGTDPAARNILHLCLAWTDDEGENWRHKDITSMIDGGHGWRAHFNPTGHGIQLRQGLWTGRLIQPGIIIDSEGISRAIAICSDDHGVTWFASNPVGDAITEASMIELSDGRVLLKGRTGDSEKCFTSFSTNGGRTFPDMTADTNSTYSSCFAAVERGFPCAEPGSAQSSVLIYVDKIGGAGEGKSVLMVSPDDGGTVTPTVDFGLVAYGTVDVVSMPDQALCCVAYEDNTGISTHTLSFDQLGLFDLARGWNAREEDQLALLAEFAAEISSAPTDSHVREVPPGNSVPNVPVVPQARKISVKYAENHFRRSVREQGHQPRARGTEDQ